MPKTINITSHTEETLPTLLSRTQCILKQVSNETAMTANWFNASVNQSLENIAATQAQSGFHDLYLKCLFYSVLLQAIVKHHFLAIPKSQQVLIELLFNPSLEANMLNLYDRIDLVELMDNYFDTNAEYIDSDAFENDIDFTWDTLAFFPLLNKSIDQYISWYQTKVMNKAVTDPNEKLSVISKHFSELNNNSTFDAGMSEEIERTLHNGEYLGTTGLFPCIGIITLLEKENHPPQALLYHSVGSHDGYIADTWAKHKDRGFNLSFYLIGGLACDFDQFLGIISSGKYPIKDVYLATPVNAVIDCICYCENNTIKIDSLMRIPSPILRRTDSYSYSNDSSDESSSIEDISDELSSDETIAQNRQNLTCINYGNNGSDTFFDKTGTNSKKTKRSNIEPLESDKREEKKLRR